MGVKTKCPIKAMYPCFQIPNAPSAVCFVLSLMDDEFSLFDLILKLTFESNDNCAAAFIIIPFSLQAYEMYINVINLILHQGATQ